jgi:hypothetical protein
MVVKVAVMVVVKEVVAGVGRGQERAREEGDSGS